MTEPEAVRGMRDRFNALAARPVRFAVSQAEYDAYEASLQAEQARRIAEWHAAGSPDEWDENLALLFCGPHGWLTFKGVELQVA